jgi:hypothetical protein
MAESKKDGKFTGEYKKTGNEPVTDEEKALLKKVNWNGEK